MRVKEATIMVNIINCYCCPFVDEPWDLFRAPTQNYRCKKKRKEIEDYGGFGIPDWCPLEDWRSK